MTIIRKLARGLLAVAITSSLVACAGTVTNVVSENKKDNSGAYDGKWNVNMDKTPSPQYIHDWTMTCSKPSAEIALTVANGVVNARAGGNTFQTFLNSSGRFRLEIPTSYKATASIASDISLDNGGITLIVQGDLKKTAPIGKLVVGIAAFGNAGCETRLYFDKADS